MTYSFGECAVDFRRGVIVVNADGNCQFHTEYKLTNYTWSMVTPYRFLDVCSQPNYISYVYVLKGCQVFF